MIGGDAFSPKPLHDRPQQVLEARFEVVDRQHFDLRWREVRACLALYDKDKLNNQMLEQFGSVEAVLAADEHDLLNVAGIGTGRAKSIRWAVGESITLYEENDLPI